MEQQVTPYLMYEDGAAAVEFLTKAFGFSELSRSTGVAGGLHADLEVTPGGGRIMLGQPPEGFSNPAVVGRTSLVYAIVDEVDEHYSRAKSAGARIIAELSDQDYGHRRYGCVDPQGHEWYFAQPIAEAGSDG